MSKKDLNPLIRGVAHFATRKYDWYLMGYRGIDGGMVGWWDGWNDYDGPIWALHGEV